MSDHRHPSCDCHSGTTGKGAVPERIVPHPTDPDRTVCLDACIADAVQHLWAHGVHTLGSCCGHGWDAPSIVLSSAREASEAIRLLSEHNPDRRIEVLAWVLASFGVSRGTER